MNNVKLEWVQSDNWEDLEVGRTYIVECYVDSCREKDAEFHIANPSTNGNGGFFLVVGNRFYFDVTLIRYADFTGVLPEPTHIPGTLKF